jgi:hypothetical protein
MAKKRFALRADQIRPLAEGRGGCIGKVGYMYREEPDNDIDSGWRFTAGRESEEYMDNPDNHGIYDVNTIANYDPEIIPFLDARPGSALERDRGSGKFVEIERELHE